MSLKQVQPLPLHPTNKHDVDASVHNSTSSEQWQRPLHRQGGKWKNNLERCSLTDDLHQLSQQSCIWLKVQLEISTLSLLAATISLPSELYRSVAAFLGSVQNLNRPKKMVMETSQILLQGFQGHEVVFKPHLVKSSILSGNCKSSWKHFICHYTPTDVTCRVMWPVHWAVKLDTWTNIWTAAEGEFPLYQSPKRKIKQPFCTE